MKRFGMAVILCAALAAGAVTGCSATAGSASAASAEPASESASMQASSDAASAAASANAAREAVKAASGGVFSADDLFTNRDLEQTADTSDAKLITVKSGEDVLIDEEGVYVLSGEASEVTITVDVDSSEKVQLVLDGLSISNTSAPAIYVASADKVFLTTAAGSQNSLSTTGAFAATSDANVDGVIFAKDDLVLNGQGTLTIESTANGIVGKDDVKVTGGTYIIEAAGHGIEGKDSVAIADGTFSITAGTDGIHSENSDDASLGSIYVAGGTFTIRAGSDGLGGTAVVQVDGGTFDISADEGIEATYVQVNDGVIGIQASDDGINAASKTTAYSVKLEINGGSIDIDMAAGDTDALDSNGDLIVNGGTVNITAQFAFDFDGAGELNGGTVIVNGEQVTELTNSMMMGGGMGGMGGMGGAGSMGGPGNMGGDQQNRQGPMR